MPSQSAPQPAAVDRSAFDRGATRARDSLASSRHAGGVDDPETAYERGRRRGVQWFSSLAGRGILMSRPPLTRRLKG